ncbi:hypothetical protein E2C01_066757 [Portunus trituberculatus]|uniref:Uncharacterized protein n=1 Tax=Portunus trituberculatus TaxID=210409 RepID=A0A5B7HI04_PORTR|nr:hypothetical protein [Portunus trituberculatus]
MRLPGDRQV